MAIKPIGDKILIELIEEDAEKVGSIYVPDTAKEKPQMGKVVSVGEGKYEDGKLVPLSVKKGDKVLFRTYAGTDIKHGGNEYLILSESDLLAIVE